MAAHAAAAVSGLGVLGVAIGSQFTVDGHDEVPAAVLRHVLLMMVAPALLVLARPRALLEAVAPGTPPAHRSPGRVVRALSGPAGWVLFYLSMPLYFLTPLFGRSLVDPALDAGVELWFFAIGCLYWYGLGEAGPDPTGAALPPGGVGPTAPVDASRRFGIRLVAVLAGMPIELALAVALLLWPRPIAPHSTVSATHAAGLVFWLASMVISGASLALLVVWWARRDERQMRLYETGEAGLREAR